MNPLQKETVERQEKSAILTKEWYEENKSNIAERTIANLLSAPIIVPFSVVVSTILLWILSLLSDTIKSFIVGNPVFVVLFLILLCTSTWLILIRFKTKKLLIENEDLLFENTRLKEVENRLIVDIDTLKNENKELSNSSNVPETLIETTAMSKSAGFITVHEKLFDSPYFPEKCLPDIEHHLDFMGNGASKWTWKISPENLKNALDRISQNNGKARFLILNPLDEKSVIDESSKKNIVLSLKQLNILKRQLSKKNALEIKVYNNIPQFRLTFIDQRILVIGHYGGKHRGDSNESPLLEFCGDDNVWSFYHAFSDYFEREWHSAMEPDWEQIEKLYEKLY